MKRLYICLIIFDLFMGTIIWLPHLNLFETRVFVDNSNSMWPKIKAGSVIFTKKTNSYKKGDIITFQSDPISTTHRIYKIINRNGKDFFVTKGDQNDALDSYLVSQENIIGKVIYIIPYLGLLLMALKTRFGLYLFIFLPTLIIMLVELKKLFTEIKNR